MQDEVLHQYFKLKVKVNSRDKIYQKIIKLQYIIKVRPWLVKRIPHFCVFYYSYFKSKCIMDFAFL